MSVRNLRQKKIEIRSRHKKLREGFPVEKKAEFDDAIAERFLSLPEYKNCKTLLAFISKDIEVETKKIVAKAFEDGKRVAVPKCDTETTTIAFYEISSYDDLESGFYGLLEPKPECKWVEDFSDCICMVPGLVYDRDGYRLGFGKGYYDRFLLNFEGVTVGVCYSRCVEHELPRGYYDRPINMVVTERYTIDTR